MNVKDLFKKNNLIRRIMKRIKIMSEFKYDSTDFIKFYMESAEKRGDYRYRILLLVHSIEKGLCMPNIRQFGNDKVKTLMRILSKYDEEDKKQFEYILGVSALYSWIDTFDENNWTRNKEYNEVYEFLKNEKECNIEVGSKKYKYCLEKCDDKYYEILSSRHSVRDYQDKKILQEDIDFAIKCFLETPTACNRQMCRIYYINDYERKKMLDEIIIGISGVNKNTVQYFIITYDISAFDYSGERNQGLFNAGLCSMNFINALHVKGIGSCCLQWSNKHREDVMVRNNLRLNKNERIAIVIGAGYYLDEYKIPCSKRRNVQDVYKVI